MSRSYKKTPRSGDTKNKFLKRYANRKLRHNRNHDVILQNKTYRKTFCYYDICDFEEIGTTFEQFYARCIRYWHRWRKYHNEPFPTREKAWQVYLKWYKRK